MRKRSIKQNLVCTLLIFFLIFLAAGCSDEKGSNPFSSWNDFYGEEVERWMDGEGVDRIDVTTINGSIRVNGFTGFGVSGGGGDQIYIYARKEIGASSLKEAEEFAAQVEIQTIREGNTIRVFSEYPEPPPHIQVMVSFEIESPREVDLTLHTANGTCWVDGMIGAVQAATANGNVVADIIEITGDSRFTTINGVVDVGIRDGIAPLTGATVNGSITLRLHHGFDGILDAQTGNGEITCNFPIHDTGHNTPNHLTGTLGVGGSTPVSLSAVNGNIYLDLY
jgi:DUF4097 and DUF4098 domain-containing protein YvlB